MTCHHNTDITHATTKSFRWKYNLSICYHHSIILHYLFFLSHSYQHTTILHHCTPVCNCIIITTIITIIIIFIIIFIIIIIIIGSTVMYGTSYAHSISPTAASTMKGTPHWARDLSLDPTPHSSGNTYLTTTTIRPTTIRSSIIITTTEAQQHQTMPFHQILHLSKLLLPMLLLQMLV